MIPADFDITPTGQLVLNLPPSPADNDVEELRYHNGDQQLGNGGTVNSNDEVQVWKLYILMAFTSIN